MRELRNEFCLANCENDRKIMEIYQNLISSLPKTRTSMIFAYGSGAVAQVGHNQSDNMVDFIIVVDDPEEWHSINLKMNKNHYSCLRFLGAKHLTNIQNNYAARIYYNTLVRVGDRLIKYGVIQTKHLIADLIDWESLYVAGRLHKPVRLIYQAKNVEMKEALTLNLRSACRAALLLLPERFSYEQFFTAITSLSYDGDFRQYFGEDRQKITKIVRANLDSFTTIYEPLLNSLDQTFVEPDKRRVTQDLSSAAVCSHLEQLPKRVLWHMQTKVNRDGRRRDLEEVIVRVASDFEFQDDVRLAIKKIVTSSSINQTFKNLFTAGVRKSVIYGFKKMTKMIRSIAR